MKPNLFLSFFLLLVTSCEMFRYHPYEDVEGCESALTVKNIALIEQLGRSRDTLRFAFISDTQRQYDDTRDAIDYINGLDGIDFVLHGGDFTDFGATFEFEWMYHEINRLDVPYLTVIGNHDFLGTGEHTYQHIFGPYNYSVNIGHLHLLALNTSSREQDYTIHVPDFEFIFDDIEQVSNLNRQFPDSITHTIILMHARPGDEQFNNNVALPFAKYIQNYPGLRESDPLFSDDDIRVMKQHCSPYGQVLADDEKVILGSPKRGCCLNGHNHQHQLYHALNDKTLFYGVPDIHKRQLFIFTIYPDGYDYETQTF